MAVLFYLSGALPLYSIRKKRKKSDALDLRNRAKSLKLRTYISTIAFTLWYALIVFIFLGNLEKTGTQYTTVLGLQPVVIEVFVFGTSPVIIALVLYVWLTVFISNKRLNHDNNATH
ncbi:MAG: hypothetical protein M0Z77_08095 [Thermoplasmatales archaeon]|nr:hypothetical protein [Thermoplasmatales archaeon]